VFDESIAIGIAIRGHPLQRGLRVGQQLAGEIEVAGPAHVLAERHQKQRRRVDTAVVRAVRHTLEPGELTYAHLVQDLAWLFVAEVVDLLALVPRQESERPGRNGWAQRQRLNRGDQAVTAKRHGEPWDSS